MLAYFSPLNTIMEKVKDPDPEDPDPDPDPNL
jgi:hypothetical protein